MSEPVAIHPLVAVEGPASSQTRLASSPFDRSDADLILHTNDDVNFSVHRLVLSIASSVFETMFSLPQPPGTEARPSVDVSEDSQTMETFLRIVYPVADPDIKSLQHLREVLAAGTKYDTPAVIAVCCKALTQQTFIQADPLRVFAIACIFGLEAEAKAAAEAAVLNHRVKAGAEPCTEIAEVTAGAYFRLLKLNRTRPSAWGKREFVDFTTIGPFCESPHSCAANRSPPLETWDSHQPFGDASFPPDIVFRSQDGFEFPAHQVIIEMASSAMLTMLSRSDRPSGDQKLPAYELEDGALVVKELLHLCYPVRHLPSLTTDSQHFLDVLYASRKYHLHRAEVILRAQWSAVAGKEPLQFYFAAVRCGWKEEALTCARELINRSDDVSLIQTQYSPVMESIKNRSYLDLLAYVQECAKAASSIPTLAISEVAEKLQYMATDCWPCKPESAILALGNRRKVLQGLAVSTKSLHVVHFREAVSKRSH